METSGKFIVVEGFDGAGKSTFCERLAKALRGVGHVVTSVRQPGGTPLAETIRRVHKSTDIDEPVSLTTEYLLMSAARHQLWFARIEPELKLGHIVLSDRHTQSSYAYQNMLLPDVEKVAAGKPDFTIWLDVDYDVAMARLAGKGEDCRIEQKGDDFLKQVHERYEIAYDQIRFSRRTRINSNDFNSEQYEADCKNAIDRVLTLCSNVMPL